MGGGETPWNRSGGEKMCRVIFSMGVELLSWGQKVVVCGCRRVLVFWATGSRLDSAVFVAVQEKFWAIAGGVPENAQEARRRA